MGRLAGIAVLLAAVVGAVVLSSLAGTSITASTNPQKTSAAPARPSSSCTAPARQGSSVLAPLQGTPTPTPTGTFVVPTPTRTAVPPTPTTTPIAPTPTEVQVVAFSGKRVTKSKVQLHWRTASSVNLLGFNVYCGSSHRVKRNAHLILAHSGVHNYSFGDRVAQKVRHPGPYWLQLVDPNGHRSWFGSVVIH
jgi:hypothetical protein